MNYKKIYISIISLLLISLSITGIGIQNKIVTESKANQVAIAEIIFERAITSDDISNIKKLGGRIIYRFDKINGLAVAINPNKIDRLKSLPGIKEFGLAVRIETTGINYEKLPASDDHGVLSWNLDTINIPTLHNLYNLTGSGVYIAVLDTGLEPQWRDYFPEEKIDSDHAAAFLGALATAYWVTGKVLNKNAWEADTNGHGMHVTSTIIGFRVYDFYTVDGVAPNAKVIPVKVLGNAGFGFSTDVAAGIMYIAEIFERELATGGNELKPDGVVNPVIISMSLGGPQLTPLEKAAIDYAISLGVFIVAAAGNAGEDGMAYPAAYQPVISVGAAGWIGEWIVNDSFNINWWRISDVPEDLSYAIYVTEFSSRELPGQDLDVLAPGSWIVGPYTPYGAANPPYWAEGVPGEYYFLAGTSMATPHVSGVLALLLEKDLADGVIDLNQYVAEEILESSALKITWFNATVYDVFAESYKTVTWSTNAVGEGFLQADMAYVALQRYLGES